MSKLLVIKFGGSVLKNGLDIKNSAEQVKAKLKQGNKVVVVVSALKGVTDKLIEVTKEIHTDIPRDVQDNIIRLGEEQSTRLFASALKLIDIPAEEINIDSPRWPIITDDNYGDAYPILEKCNHVVKLGIVPLLERGVTPVVCGFVGISMNGVVTTLGRGGSDTTAIVLSNCLSADELILVKDVGGVFSADPHLVPSSRKLLEMSGREAYLISSNGAKVIHEKVFRYLTSDFDIRITGKEDYLLNGGTVVRGQVLE